MDEAENLNMIKELEVLCQNVIQEKQNINNSIEQLEADKPKREVRRREILLREMKQALAAYSKIDQNIISEMKVDAFDKTVEAQKIFEEANNIQCALKNQPCNKDIYRHQVTLLKEREARLSLRFFNKNINLSIQSSQDVFGDIQEKYSDAIWHVSGSLQPDKFLIERVNNEESDKFVQLQILHRDPHIFHETLTLQRLKLTVVDAETKETLEEVSLLEKFNKSEVTIGSGASHCASLTVKLKRRPPMFVYVKLFGSNLIDSPVVVSAASSQKSNLSMAITNDSLSPAIFDQSMPVGKSGLPPANAATVYEGYEGLDSSDLNSLDITNRRMLQSNALSTSIRKASQPPNMSTVVEAEESLANNIPSARPKFHMGITPLMKQLEVQDPPGSASNSPFNPKRSMASTMMGDTGHNLDNTARDDFTMDEVNVEVTNSSRKLVIAEETYQDASCFINDKTLAINEGQNKDEDDDPHIMLNASKAPSPNSANKTIAPDPCWNEDYESPSKVKDNNMSLLPDYTIMEEPDVTLWEDCVQDPGKFSLARGRLELVNVLKSQSISKSSTRGDQKCLREPHSVAYIPSLNILLVSEPSFNRIGVYSPSDLVFLQWFQMNDRPFKTPSHILCQEELLVIIEKDQITFFSLKASTCVYKDKLKGNFQGLACSQSGDIFTVQEGVANSYMVTIRNQEIVGKIIINRNKTRSVCKDKASFIDYKDDHVFVVDSNNHRLFKINVHDGSFEQTGYLGNNFGQFNNPTGVMVDEEEAILVADRRNNRLLVFGRDLKIVKVG